MGVVLAVERLLSGARWGNGEGGVGTGGAAEERQVRTGELGVLSGQ